MFKFVMVMSCMAFLYYRVFTLEVFDCEMIQAHFPSIFVLIIYVGCHLRIAKGVISAFHVHMEISHKNKF